MTKGEQKEVNCHVRLGKGYICLYPNNNIVEDSGYLNKMSEWCEYVRRHNIPRHLYTARKTE